MADQPSKSYPHLRTQDFKDYVLLHIDTGEEGIQHPPFAVIYNGDYTPPSGRGGWATRVNPGDGADAFEHHPKHLSPAAPVEKSTFTNIGKMFGEVLPPAYYNAVFKDIPAALVQVEYFLTMNEKYRHAWGSGNSFGAWVFSDLTVLIRNLTKDLEEFGNSGTSWPGASPHMVATRFIGIADEFVRRAGAKASPFKPGTSMFLYGCRLNDVQTTMGLLINNIGTAVENLRQLTEPQTMVRDNFVAGVGALKHSLLCFSQWLSERSKHLNQNHGSGVIQGDWQRHPAL